MHTAFYSVHTTLITSQTVIVRIYDTCSSRLRSQRPDHAMRFKLNKIQTKQSRLINKEKEKKRIFSLFD